MGKKIMITAIAIVVGAALMFVLNRFAAIPTGVPDTSIQLGYGVLAACAAIFGPIAGFLIGFIGHALVDFSWGGWDGIWWSWVISSAVCGCAIGAFWKSYSVEEGFFELKECLIFNGVQAATNILVWVFLARTLDMIIYNEPFGKVTLQGFTAAGFNIAVVLVFGSLLTWGYSKFMYKRRLLDDSDKPDRVHWD